MHTYEATSGFLSWLPCEQRFPHWRGSDMGAMEILASPQIPPIRTEKATRTRHRLSHHQNSRHRPSESLREVSWLPALGIKLDCRTNVRLTKPPVPLYADFVLGDNLYASDMNSWCKPSDDLWEAFYIQWWYANRRRRLSEALRGVFCLGSNLYLLWINSRHKGAERLWGAL